MKANMKLPDQVTHLSKMIRKEIKRKRVHNDLAHSMHLFFLRMNWDKIGEGSYAYVHGHDDYKIVIKIVNSWDAAYTKYAAFCMENYHRYKHLPKIYGRFKIGTNQHVYILERLKSVTGSAYMLVDRIDFAFRKYWSTVPPYYVQISRRKVEPSIAKTIRKLPESLKKDCIDIHRGNLMYRKNGTLVLSDVFC